MTLTKSKIRLIAQDFWSSTPVEYTPPCDLSHAAQLIFPINITSFPKLALTPVKAWFESRNIPLPIQQDCRKLCACLVAYEGMGMVFLDGTDPEDERRFSLAHELAHFILDYHLVRLEAVERLGDGITEVLDGKRKASIEERLDGIFAGIDVGPFVHTMHRTKNGKIPTDIIQQSENMADTLALELVAPFECVRKYMSGKWERWRDPISKATVTKDASSHFGIPEFFMHEHIDLISIERTVAQPFTAWLRN
jgi:hypothetical protein